MGVFSAQYCARILTHMVDGCMVYSLLAVSCVIVYSLLTVLHVLPEVSML